jgi:predicted dehydrogenase
LANRAGPVVMTYRMNAGAIAQSHWVQGEQGGGRNIGEACHIYDLFTYFTGARVTDIRATSIGVQDGTMLKNENFSASLSFADGSLANLIYTSLGDTAWPKERLELFCDSRFYLMDDYTSLRSSPTGPALWDGTMDKGHRCEVESLADALATGGEWPIPLWQQLQASSVSLEVERLIYARS